MASEVRMVRSRTTDSSVNDEVINRQATGLAQMPLPASWPRLCVKPAAWWRLLSTSAVLPCRHPRSACKRDGTKCLMTPWYMERQRPVNHGSWNVRSLTGMHKTLDIIN